MVRISGIDLLEKRRLEIALTSIYGIGRSNASLILKEAKISKDKRVSDLKEEEVVKIQKIIDKDFIVEGDLRREVAENIKRLKTIGSYRGIRHSKNLPARGQRTRSNARTKRGKRKTVGAMKKEQRAKMGKMEKKEEKKKEEKK